MSRWQKTAFIVLQLREGVGINHARLLHCIFREREKKKMKTRRITSEAVELRALTFLSSLSRGDLIWPRSLRPADRRLEVRAAAPDGLLLIVGGRRGDTVAVALH